jgi:hypothetical protein
VNIVAGVQSPPVTRWNVGRLTGDNFNTNRSAFIGSVGDFMGLFLVCKQGVFPATRPDVVFYNPGREVQVTAFVDVAIAQYVR